MSEVDNAMEVFEVAAKTSEGTQQLTLPIVGAHVFQRAYEEYPEKVRSFLDRVIVAEHPDHGLEMLQRGGALKFLLPEVNSLVGFGGGEWGDKDIWKHTKTVVLQAEARLETRWGALFHDIGKLKTRALHNGEVHFLGHETVGAKMFVKLEKRLRLFGKEEALRDTIHFLVLNHLRASGYSSDWTDSAVRRFAKEMGCQLGNLMSLTRADLTTANARKRNKILAGLDELEQRIKKLAEEDAKPPTLPAGIGDAIGLAFGIPPSKQLGDVRRTLEKRVLNGEVPQGLMIDEYVDLIRNDRERYGL
jgi:poly(A) polymerase